MTPGSRLSICLSARSTWYALGAGFSFVGCLNSFFDLGNVQNLDILTPNSESKGYLYPISFLRLFSIGEGCHASFDDESLLDFFKKQFKNCGEG